MKQTGFRLITAAFSWGACLSGPMAALAQDASDDRREQDRFAFTRDLPFTVQAETGIEYDSNVTVLEIDSTTGAGDFAAVFDLDLGYETEIATRTDFGVSYAFSQDLQFDFTEFNTQIHRIGAEIVHDAGPADIGASYQLVHSRLDGAGFLTIQRFSPFVSGYLADRRIFLRAAYLYADKNFSGRADRDASVHAGSIDAYYFIDGVKQYILAGYRYEAENTVAPEFDFTSHNFKVRFNQRIKAGSKTLKFQAGARYENRDYKSVTPSIGAIRDDVRYKLETSLTLPLGEKFFITASYDYDIFNSNLPTLDFKQSVAALRFGAEF